MAKLVCVACEIELMPEVNGTLVIETASFGPYKVWDADTWKCPKCGVEVVTGFGQRPLMEHFEDGFVEWPEDKKAQAKKIVYDNEH
jgi:hypothetical protein